MSRIYSSSMFTRALISRSSFTLIITIILISHSGVSDCQLEYRRAPVSRVRVLMVRNSEHQRAIEEAAALSVDLPVSEALAKNDNSSQNGTSLGYRQRSLASLTLQQKDSRASADQPNEQTSPRGKRTSDDPEQITAKRLRAHQQEDPWTELKLPRLKPTWLNVSKQFKITGETVEEVEVLMPAEYMLRAAFDSPILLKTKLGILEGVRSIRFNKFLYTFLSVPYARAPTGELRFMAPQPTERWEGILQATKWPPFCVQPSMTLASKSSPVHILAQMMSEDCLYMNIWTPSLKFNKHHKRPVMVWLHGGAFQYGGISVDENDGSALALLGDVVVVTLNYRISAFGFLNANNPRQAPNNVGLLDQRMALEWVQANIRQFGGDPQQVTLFGESAGGHSVGLHMISPASHALFKRAILQSGVPISLLRSYDVNGDNTGSTMAEGVSSVMIARRLKCYVANEELISNNEATPTAEDSSESDAPNGTTMSTRIIEDDSNTTIDNASSVDADLETTDVEVTILNDATLDCMRSKTSLDILKAMGAPGNAGYFPTGNDLKGFFPNGPIMESFNPDDLKIGPQKDFLIGTNTDEGTFMLHYGMSTVFPARSEPKVDNIDSLKSAIIAEIEKLARASSKTANSTENQSQGKHNGGAQAHLYKPLLRTSSSILESFMPKSQIRTTENGTVIGNVSKQLEFGRNIGSLITDIIFLCPARSLARTLAESGRNVYFYLYGHRSSQSQYHDWIGVTHHDEVEFVFGRPLRMADVYSGKDIEMSQRIIKTWSHFAYTGQMPDQLGVSWPKYDPDDNKYLTLVADKVTVGQRYHDKVCNVYDTVISVHLTDN